MDRDGIESGLSSLVFDRASLLTLVTDREGVILRASRYAEELTGRELRSLPFAAILVDFASEFDMGKALDPPGMRTLNVATQDGPPQTFCFHFADCGEEILVLGEHTYRDNEALRANLIELNGEVGNLNRELQKKAVQLEQLSAQKSRFLGIAAHDLRNPIGGIRGLSAVLKEEATASGDEARAEIFDQMRESTGFMLELIEDLLSAITIESGAMHLNLVATDLNEVIASNVRLNRIVADAKGVRLDANPGEQLPAMQIDRLKMHQVLNNLVSNAVKFSPRGSAVTVSVAREGASVIVSVQDSGPGIPASEFEKLFKPFQQTTIRAPAGEASSGLGLSIVKAIVEKHHGRIWVESDVGVGSIFRVSLPVSTEGQSANEEVPHDEG